MRPDATHSYEDDLESFMHVMLWVSLKYMEADMTPRARFNTLENTFEQDDGDDEHGRALGGHFKSRALHAGSFCHRFTFKEPRVGPLLGGLAISFSCRYGSYQLTEEERHKRVKDLENFNTFNCTFQTLLGEESNWKFPASAELQPADPGRFGLRPGVREGTSQRTLRMVGHWPGAPIAHTQTAGTVPITFYPSPRPAQVTHRLH